MNKLLFLLKIGLISQHKRLSLYPLPDILALNLNDYLKEIL